MQSIIDKVADANFYVFGEEKAKEKGGEKLQIKASIDVHGADLMMTDAQNNEKSDNETQKEINATQLKKYETANPK